MATESAGHGEKSRLWEATIAALLVCPSMKAAAKKVGISPTTLNSWLEDPAFDQMYRAARRQVVRQAVANLSKSCSAAVRTLTRNLRCGKPSTEVRAAEVLLGFVVKSVEIDDLAAEIAELKAWQEQQKKDTPR